MHAESFPVPRSGPAIGRTMRAYSPLIASDRVGHQNSGADMVAGGLIQGQRSPLDNNFNMQAAEIGPIGTTPVVLSHGAQVAQATRGMQAPSRARPSLPRTAGSPRPTQPAHSHERRATPGVQQRIPCRVLGCQRAGDATWHATLILWPWPYNV